LVVLVVGLHILAFESQGRVVGPMVTKKTTPIQNQIQNSKLKNQIVVLK